MGSFNYCNHLSFILKFLFNFFLTIPFLTKQTLERVLILVQQYAMLTAAQAA